MNEITQLVAETADRLFAEQATPVARDQADAGVFPDALWAAFADAGLLEVLSPDRGGGVSAAMAVAYAIGRHAAPGPLVETIAANALLERWGLEFSPADKRSLAVATETSRSAEAVWADAVDEILVVAEGPQGLRFARIAGLDVELRAPFPRLAEPVFRFDLDAIDPSAWMEAPGTLAEALADVSLLRAGQIVGALEWCLERTVAYAQDRRQFGREIGKLQIIQQHVAQLACETTAAAAVVAAATQRAEEGGDSLMLAVARSRLADAIDGAVWLSHQVHGAIGFSREYELNDRTRRLMGWRDQFGTAEHWRLQLGGALISHAADEIWPRLAAV